MYENKKKEWNHKTIIGRPICLSMLQTTIQIWFQLLSSYKFLPLPVMFLPQCLSLSCPNVPGSFPAVLHPIPCLAWNGFSFNLIISLPVLPLASELNVTFSVKMSVSPPQAELDILDSALSELLFFVYFTVDASSPTAPQLFVGMLISSTKL